MAATPRYKVYDAANVYRAAFKHLEDAAAFVAVLGDDATIRDGHSRRHVIWHEGNEDQPAAESYDHVFDVAMARR